MDETMLRALVDLRDRTLQKARIGFGNRMSAIERGTDIPTNGSYEMLKKWYERFDELEREADDDIADLAKDQDIVQEVVKLKGISYTLAAKLISMIDITRADTVSALWRYAGYGVVDGVREKPTKGEKLHYNARLKSTCYLIGSSFLKCNSPYRRIYDDAKTYYEVNRTDWTKAHRHNAALRKMIKVFLSHLWLVWREQEGLPTRNLYAEERLGHEHYISPDEFGWQPKEDE